MIEFDNGGRLVQELSELPNLSHAKDLYCDFETTSFDPKQEAFKPHHGHRICGICITADDHKGAWYIPIRCSRKQWNLPLDSVLSWLRDTIGTCENWVNHGVKFDAHFARYDDIHFNGKLVDTAVLAKLINSDRFQYGLKELSLDWLDESIDEHGDRLKAYLANCKSKDYGDVPGDIIGDYGCQDVITNRKLYQNLLRRRSEGLIGVWDTEIALTPALFDMEVTGMRVDPLQLQIAEVKILNVLIKQEEELHKILGFPIRPHTNADCYEALCNHYGLPILARTEGGKDEDGNKKEGGPSFGKDAMISYLSHPIVLENETIREVVLLIQKYRKLNTLLTFFVRPYQEHNVNGIMHPDYNQIVRTGRMSCRRPNAQQLSPAAKALILPLEDYDFVSFDYAQIEFRLIVHYIRDYEATEAYKRDPDTDFHNWVAEMCGILRKPAKSINFAIAFGGGKKKVVSMLASNMDIVGGLSEKIDQLIESGKVLESERASMFQLLCYKKGEKVYNDYHDALPGLKSTTYRASESLKNRGYVFNAYGRERRLPEKAAFRAFNTIIQSSAADVMKERTVALAPRYNKKIRDLGIALGALVHDETLLNVPKEISKDYDLFREIKALLEDVSVEFTVPIRTSCGSSEKNWKIASGDAGKIELYKKGVKVYA